MIKRYIIIAGIFLTGMRMLAAGAKQPNMLVVVADTKFHMLYSAGNPENKRVLEQLETELQKQIREVDIFPDQLPGEAQ